MITAVAQAQPRDLYVRAGHSRQAVIYTNRGNDLFDKNDFEGALRNFDLAIRLDHTMWPAYYNRARVFMKQHKWKKVIQDENAVIRIKPSFLWATVMRGSANLRLGNYSSSLADFENVLTLHPDAEVRAVALNNRAWLRAVCPDPSFRNGPQAVADASRACAMSHWKIDRYVGTLAAAYAECGDFEAARRIQKQAISLIHDTEDLKEARHLLGMCEKHQAFRQFPE